MKIKIRNIDKRGFYWEGDVKTVYFSNVDVEWVGKEEDEDMVITTSRVCQIENRGEDCIFLSSKKEDKE